MTVTVTDERNKKRQLTLFGMNTVPELLDAGMFMDMIVSFGISDHYWYTSDGNACLARPGVKQMLKQYNQDQLRLDAVDIDVNLNASACCIYMQKL